MNKFKIILQNFRLIFEEREVVEDKPVTVRIKLYDGNSYVDWWILELEKERIIESNRMSSLAYQITAEII